MQANTMMMIMSFTEDQLSKRFAMDRKSVDNDQQ